MLGFVYWNASTNSSHETAINSATLAGCILGMIIFGFAGDRYGRRKMYGIELLLLIIGTMGVVMSSPGYIPVGNAINNKDVNWGTYGSMNILSWLIFFRFISGCGVGGDYPLSAVIVSEFAPTKKRARMLATVFAMQAFGYATATIVSIIVVVGVRHVHPSASPRSVDQIWRWVMGIGLLPAVAAVVLRLTIPETPRYTLDILNDPFKAFEETNRFNATSLEDEYNHQSNLELASVFATHKTEPDNRSQSSSQQGHDQGPTFQESVLSEVSVCNFFLVEGNWRTLLGTSLAWFLLDFA
jgi:MFS transporter, PHS family, inorganic phosphate transporter